MRTKFQKYLSGEKEGFSLVELIIVIAIMAILIGIVALAVIPYLEKSRVAKDQQTVDTVYSAFQATVADCKVSDDSTIVIPAKGDPTPNGDCTAQFITDMKKLLGTTGDMSAGTTEKLESKDAKGGTITCSFVKATGAITVQVTGNNDIKSTNR